MRSAVFFAALFVAALVLNDAMLQWAAQRSLILTPSLRAALAVAPTVWLLVCLGLWFYLEQRELIRMLDGRGKRGPAPWILAPIHRRLMQWLRLHRQERKAHQERLGDLAHEIRAVLALMQGEITATQDGLRSPDAQWMARLQGDIELLDHLARALSRETPLAPVCTGEAPRHIALEACIREVAERFRHDMACRRLSWQLAYDTHCWLYGDAHALSRLFANLMSNTLRHADIGSCLQVQVRRVDSSLIVCWEDSGPGIDDGTLAQLGRRGFRAHPDRPGTGHGLAIARDIVEAHGGKMQFAQGTSGGLRIEIRLPERGVA